MADTSVNLPRFTQADLPKDMTLEEAEANRFTEAALERHKREGMDLALWARWVALGVVGALIPFLNFGWDMLYYEVMLLLMAANGWLLRRVGRVGQSRAELAVLFVDVALLVFVLTFPNPFSPLDWPTAMFYRFDTFVYLFLLPVLGTMAFSWRTIMAIGNWSAALWILGAVLVWQFGVTDPALTDAVAEALGDDEFTAQMLDPNAINWDGRVQEAVMLLLVAGILAISMRRYNRLLLGNAALERERENLSRYFSPNVVDQLSRNDEPLKEIRSHDVAAVFVDIKGFTRYSADRAPSDVIATLREFHGLMERAVFAHGGTLDKYLGDGLMATFGTPSPRPDDVLRAYHCVRQITILADGWNKERRAAGEPELSVSVGLHYGPVVLGDIGVNRLEYAVIGNTVNVASRMEALTRDLDAQLVISDDVYRRLPEEITEDLLRHDGQTIRGFDEPVSVWALKQHGPV